MKFLDVRIDCKCSFAVAMRVGGNDRFVESKYIMFRARAIVEGTMTRRSRNWSSGRASRGMMHDAHNF